MGRTLSEYPQPQLVHHKDLWLNVVSLTVPVDYLVCVPRSSVDTMVEELVESPPRMERW